MCLLRNSEFVLYVIIPCRKLYRVKNILISLTVVATADEKNCKHHFPVMGIDYLKSSLTTITFSITL